MISVFINVFLRSGTHKNPIFFIDIYWFYIKLPENKKLVVVIIINTFSLSLTVAEEREFGPKVDSIQSSSDQHQTRSVLLHLLHAEQTHEPVNSHTVWEFYFTLDAYDLSAGFMQFVQSVPVAEVLATEGNIQVMQCIRSCLILLLEDQIPAKFGSEPN